MSPAAVDRDLPGHQDWATPQAFFDAVAAKLGPFTLDVCASGLNAKCDRFFTEAQDGLSQPWGAGETIWCNPPYGNPGPWFERGWNAAHDGCTVVFLVPASTDVAWFVDAARGDLFFVQGRLKFEAPPDYDGGNPGANFGSVVVVFSPKHVDGRKPICGFVDRQFRMVIPSRKMAQMPLW